MCQSERIYVPRETCGGLYFELEKARRVEQYPGTVETPTLQQTGQYILDLREGVISLSDHVEAIGKGDEIAEDAEQFFTGQIQARKTRELQLSFTGIV